MSMTREQAVEAIIELGRRERGKDARDHFRTDSDRHSALTIKAADLHFDFSKQPFGNDALAAMLDLAEAVELGSKIEVMMSGGKVNETENRAAQHVALRGGGSDAVKIAQAEAERQRAYGFANSLRRGDIKAASGSRFTHVLHIGIGGSDLGPRLVYEALGGSSDPLSVRFLSSVDPAAFNAAIDGLDPATTLVFVVSKSFGTPETTHNFKLAREWLETELADRAAMNLVAATANRDAAIKASIPDDRIFEMWDWVGGRYSLWSCVSLSVMSAIGPEKFETLLDGAKRMDRHFASASLTGNAPVLSALTVYWHQLVCGVKSWAVVPYAYRLRLFVGWLQQLSMESLGKTAGLSGRAIEGPSGPAVWGGEGPDGQHAFFQLLHQGTEAVPVDIIAFARDSEGERQDPIVANAVAQAEALLVGRDAEAVRAELTSRGLSADEMDRLLPHMELPGGRGSTLILANRLNAATLGALLAFYEHQTFALSGLMGINAFDQFGVELGKKLATRIEADLQNGTTNGHDPSTNALLGLINRLSNAEGDSGA